MTEHVPAGPQRETHLERRVSQLAGCMPELADLTPAQVDKAGSKTLL